MPKKVQVVFIIIVLMQPIIIADQCMVCTKRTSKYNILSLKYKGNIYNIWYKDSLFAKTHLISTLQPTYSTLRLFGFIFESPEDPGCSSTGGTSATSSSSAGFLFSLSSWKSAEEQALVSLLGGSWFWKKKWLLRYFYINALLLPWHKLSVCKNIILASNKKTLLYCSFFKL